MSDDVSIPKQRGRPPVLRECATCRVMKPSGDFVTREAASCRECRRTGVVDPNPGFIPAHLRYQVPTGARRTELAADALGLQALNAMIATITKGFARCACCYAAIHVRDVPEAGRPFCAVCAFQVEACGRCETHHSALFIPALEGNVVPHVPREIHALFESPVSSRRDDDALASRDAASITDR